MSDANYPSGEWVGYYTYQGNERALLPLHLTLQFGGGRIRGAGVDNVGQFTIEGTCDEAGSQVRWLKRYVRKHDVHYEGAYQDGEIRGSWSLNQISQGRAVSLHGEFRLWPLPAKEYSDDEPLPSVLEKEIRRKTGVTRVVHRASGGEAKNGGN
jgi:hypothetical protein